MSAAPAVDTDRIQAGVNIVDCDGARACLAAALAGLDAHTRRRILQDNAIELYGLSRPGQG
jgi:hypothetical protein